MAHRRVKDIEYDADNHFDGYDSQDEDYGDSEKLSPEDEEQMQAGTVAVRAELGDIGSAIGDQEIREALWYYYYDIQKTVNWLQRQHAPEEYKQSSKKEKTKPATRFDQAAAAAEKVTTTGTDGITRGHGEDPNKFTAADFFADTPFLAVPSSRKGVIQPVVSQALLNFGLRPGLLGGSSGGSGSSKTSKLAALAASRKKAAEEKKKSSSTPSHEAHPPDSSGSRGQVANQDSQPQSLALLDKLQSKEPSQTSQPKTTDSTQFDESIDPSSANNFVRRAYPKREKSSREPPPPSESGLEKQDVQPSSQIESDVAQSKGKPAQIEDLQGNPSSLAIALFEPHKPTKGATDQSREKGDTAQPTEGLFTLPYPTPKESAKDIKGKDKFTNQDPFAGPSPDDVVTQAQSKGTKSNSKTQPQKTASSKPVGNKSSDVATESVAAMKLEDRPPSPTKVKSRNLDVVAEFEKSNMKNSANFVVIGHVDHGKSTLMGRLLHDLSLIPSRAFQKIQASSQQAGKASFSFAWLLDTTDSERSRGITVDIASTSFTTPTTDFTILDAPGHQDFVPNMIAGTSQADFAVLVVDATTNAFEKGMEGGGQTKEHAMLARALGVNRIIVAVNKMDYSTPPWSKDRFDAITQQMTPFLSAAGFIAKNVAFIPCAGLTGENVVNALPSAESQGSSSNGPWSWYSGPTLLQQLEITASFSPTSRVSAIRSPLRLIVSDVFKGSVIAPISITGRIDTGSLQIGDVVLAQPDGETAAIKGIELSTSSSSSAVPSSDTYSSTSPEWAVAGQIVTLHLSDIDPVHLRSGDVVCSPSSPVQNLQKFTAKVLAFDFLVPGPMDVLKGRLFTEGKVTRLIALLDKKGDGSDGNGSISSKKKPRVLKPGVLARVEVELDKALPLEAGNRIVLRSEGVSIAAGLVEGASK